MMMSGMEGIDIEVNVNSSETMIVGVASEKVIEGTWRGVLCGCLYTLREGTSDKSHSWYLRDSDDWISSNRYGRTDNY